jgi:hypothetical protein
MVVGSNRHFSRSHDPFCLATRSGQGQVVGEGVYIRAITTQKNNRIRSETKTINYTK